MKSFFRKIFVYLESVSGQWWYGPLVGLLAAADAFILVVSVEALILPAVAVRPKKWVSVALWGSLGSAIGATAFATLTSVYGESVVNHFFPHALASKTWITTMNFVLAHGLLGLAAVSMGPFPQHIGVAIAGLAHMRVYEVFAAILAGRGAKYLLLSWLTIHSPKLLKKLKILPEAKARAKAAESSEPLLSRLDHSHDQSYR